MVLTLTHESELGWPLVAGVSRARWRRRSTFPARGRRFVQQVVVVGAMSSGAMTYYAVKGVDDYQHLYLGVFFASVLLLGWTLIAMRVVLLGAGPRGATRVRSSRSGSRRGRGRRGGSTTRTSASPNAPAIADAIAADPRWQNGPPILTIHGHGWAEAGTLLIELERRGKRPWLIHPLHHIMFTDDFRPDDRPLNGLWQLDSAGS